MSVAWPMYIAGDERCSCEIDIRQVNVAWSCLVHECPGDISIAGLFLRRRCGFGLSLS